MHSPGGYKRSSRPCHLQRIIRFTPQCLPTDECHPLLSGGCRCRLTPSLASSDRPDRSKSQSTNSPSANSTINTTPTSESSLHRESDAEVIPAPQSSTAYTPMTNSTSPSSSLNRASSLSRTATTSNYVERITAQQHAIEERLVELKDQQNIENIRVGIKNTSISVDENMNVDPEPQYLHPKPIGAKQRALMRYVSLFPCFTHTAPPRPLLSCNAQHHLVCGN